MKSKKNAKSAHRTAAGKGRGARKTERNEIRFIDLFAGIGGFRVALEAVGATCVCSCENDPLAARWYRENHGDDPTGDVTVTAVAAKAVPDHDILCAGYPCQPYSTQGKGRGLADPRGRVFHAIPAILRAKRPAAFILENVASLRHRNHRRSHDRIVAALETAGYVVRETVLNAREFGLPQSRRRLFMVGFRRSLGTVPFAWPERGPLAANRDAFLDENPNPACYLSADEIADLIRASERQRAKGNQWSVKFAPRTHVRALLSAPHRTQDNIILDPGDGSWRRLTPNEYRELQGFPDGFKLPADDRHAYMLLGNSVAVPVVRAVAENVIAALRGELTGSLPRANEPAGGPFRSGTRAGRRPRATAPGADPIRKCRRNGGGTPPSPLAWYGGKGRLAPTIVKLFPPHQTYVEPFLGGGSVFFAKPPSPVEVVNDVHGDLVNFFRVLRDGAQRDRLLDLVEGSPWSRKEFCNALAARKAGRWKDDAERAWLFLVATRQARNGVGRRPSDWSYAVGKTTGGVSGRTSMWMRLPERLAVAGLRLRAAQIECGPWEEVLDRYESENTLAYLDPPYLHSTRNPHDRDSYEFEMTEEDHARLLVRLNGYKGKVVLSGYASTLYDEVLADWHRIEIDTVSSASTKKNKQDARRTEVLWLNYAPPVADAA